MVVELVHVCVRFEARGRGLGSLLMTKVPFSVFSIRIALLPKIKLYVPIHGIIYIIYYII